jgi:GTPase
VGYTNAGKSTLFNRLTSAEVLAKNMLFATLDPTMRGLKLASGRQIILSDTVGFIADLPTQLVAAFRATLEEVLEADVILHVRDIAHDETEAQRADVMRVLRELGVVADERIFIEVLNKIDLVEPDVRASMLTRNKAKLGHAGTDPIALSALTGEGALDLLLAVDTVLGQADSVIRLTLDASDGAGVAWAYENGRVLERHQSETGIQLIVAGDASTVDRFSSHYGSRIEITEREQRRRIGS